MTVEYQKVWRTMNDLELVTSKICSAREIIDAAIDRIQEHQYDKAEMMMSAAYEYLEYYLQEFDDKFKLAWQATVGDLRDGDVRNEPLTCDKNDPSPECQGAWNSFWDSYQGSTVSSVQYTDEELNAMCDKAASDEEKEKCREYNLREAEYYDKRVKLDAENPFTTDIGTVVQNGVTFQEYHKAKVYVNYSGSTDSEKEHYQKIVDKYEGKKMSHSEWHKTEWEKGRNEKLLLTHDEAIAAGWQMTDDGIWMPPQEKKRWVLPVSEIGDNYFVTFPQDLLEAAKLKEGDAIHWIDNNDGSYTIRKSIKPLGPDEC